MVKEGVTKLTSDYATDMQAIVDLCAKEKLTQKQLTKCRVKLAQTSQEFIAQCETFTGGIGSKYGKKTAAKRAKKVKSHLKSVRRKLSPRARAKEEIQQEKQMTAAYRQMLDNWKSSCVRDVGKNKAMGMQDFDLACDDLRNSSDDKLDDYASRLPELHI